MKRFFVIGIDPISKEESEGIEDWLSASEVNWWHWIDGLWLVVSHDPNLSVSDIRDNVRTISNNTTSLVVELEPVTWSGFGPRSEKQNMFTWIRKNWKKE